MLDLITAAIFVLVTSLVWLLGRILLRPHPAYARVPLASTLLSDKNESFTDDAGIFVESLAAQLPKMFGDPVELEKDFRRAGYYLPSSQLRFFALRNGLTILALIATGTVALLLNPKNHVAITWTLVLGSCAALLCFVLPRVVLAMQARQRVERIRNGLPDAMDTVSMCLHGGISLQECLGYVGQELVAVHPDLALELMMVSRQAEVNSFEFAIQQFAARIDASEIVAMASLVTQNQRLGTSIVESIREFADNLRLIQRQTAVARASRAELFLLFPVVFCLVPSVLFILWGPPILSLIDFIRGPGSPLKINM
jgi:tight adherence protein C